MAVNCYILVTRLSVLLACLCSVVQSICICNNQQCLLDNSECVHFQNLILNGSRILPDTKVEFFNGTYSLPDKLSVRNILLRDINNVTLSGDPLGSTTIQCDRRVGFSIINVTKLRITYMKFLSCGTSRGLELIRGEPLISLPEGICTALFLVNVHSLFLKNVTISYSNGYGLLCLNLFGESHIVGSNFISNHNYRARSVGGSVLLLYKNITFHHPVLVRVLISNSYFLHTYLIHDKEYTIPSISGLGIVAEQSSYTIIVVINHTNFIDNDTPMVAIYTKQTEASYDLLIQWSHFENSRSAGKKNSRSASFMHISSITKPQLGKVKVTNETATRNISIQSSVFRGSVDSTYSIGYIDISFLLNMSVTIQDSNFLPFITAPAIYVYSVYSELHPGKFLNILQSNFTGLSYGALRLLSDGYTEHLHCTIASCIFSNNTFGGSIVNIIRSYKTYHSFPARDKLSVFIICTVFAYNSDISLELGQMNNVTIVDSLFQGNSDTAIVCTGSVIYFKEATFFIGNKGIDGGAISLKPKSSQRLSRKNNWKINFENVSLIFLFPKAELVLANNRATNKGGGIYADTGEPYTGKTYNELCFYQLVGYNLSHFPKIDFINNTAGFAGDSIYGGLDKKCLLKTIRRNRIKFDDFFNISNKLSPSEMASDPDEVCLCNISVVDCNQQPANVSLYQSQTLHLNAIATRQRNHYKTHGATPALVSIRIDPEHVGKLGEGQSAQRVDNHCSKVRISVYSRDPYILVHLSLGINQFSLHQRINLIGCPFGFQLESSMYPACVCDTTVAKSQCTCSINSQTISCPFRKWIGNISNNVIIHHHCPFDYCTLERDVKVHLLNSQCAFNHSGILCGPCRPGISFIFGSSKCEYCSNTYLLLIIPFVLAGLSVMFVLYVCDFTVSKGIVNGVVYFTNVIQVNNAIFFTQRLPAVLTIFIAWMNLDLGLQTCFYDGMDMYAKAWLQFIFPCLRVANSCRYCSPEQTFCKSFKVNKRQHCARLATLFLLSYAELCILRAIITVFSFTYLHFPNGSYQFCVDV